MIRRLQQELPELLSFFVFPRHLWRKLRTTKVIERCFVEVRRSTRPMVCFVNLESVDRIICSIFQRFNLEWENPHPRANLLKQLDVTQVCSGLTMGRSRCYDRCAGWSSLVARWAHNPKVGGSNPPPATNFFNQLQPFGPERSAHFSLILPAIARQPARARPVFGHSRLGCICSLLWRCWNAARVLAAPSHRCGSHVAGKNTSAGTCASPQS